MSIDKVKAGTLLIAEPYLGDLYFERSVVMVCSHNVSGTFGLILNQCSELMLDDVLEENIYPDVPVYYGGPVSENTLHYIHRCNNLIENSSPLGNGLFWGGDFNQVKTLLNVGTLKPQDIRFFVGYSGWDKGQLAMEFRQRSWIVSETDADVLFDTPANNFWHIILKRMGGKYRNIAHYPIDPQWN